MFKKPASLESEGRAVMAPEVGTQPPTLEPFDDVEKREPSWWLEVLSDFAKETQKYPQVFRQIPRPQVSCVCYCHRHTRGPEPLRATGTRFLLT